MNGHAVYRDFERVFNEPTTHAVGAFAGERLVTAWWRLGRSAVAIEGRDVFEMPGLCTAIASTPRQLALALVTPGHVNGQSQGYGQKDRSVIVIIDVGTGEVREVLHSDEHLTFGFTQLCFAGNVLGVSAERDGKPTLVMIEGAARTESPGDFMAWARDVMPPPPGIDGLCSSPEPRRPWCDAVGLKPVACSASGARCLAQVDTRRLFVGERAGHGE
ncbi:MULTISPECIES: hypothetical protein [unclassified Corallococcus]|uniref:hypothetical protein n=1 Tax=unclassified Corallococcus TaxID=2685029 RepID=UPI001A8DA648|nr:MULTISPECIES: hypothetical protein [unclassified Corallococcus]MBN9686228.1 hypothetical protein [Corallococcus sp. NCSPR001]WAS82340.1 hypothetical protein O0N60_23780 [Corallococcus sp. NCRR]